MGIPYHSRQLTIALLAVSLAASSQAEEQSQTAGSGTTRGGEFLDEIIVTATRNEERLFDVPVAVSVVTREQIERTESSTLRQLYRYMPGVDVSRDRRGRAGEANVQIRGIGGRRVLMLVDGVRLADGFGAANAADQSRGKLDIESIARTEVVRGPASALYGSDALGGIVAFRTKRPDDFLDGSEGFAGGAGTGFDSSRDAYFLTTDLAARSGSTAGLLHATVRRSSELRNNDASLRPDPQDIDAFNIMTRLEHRLNDSHEVAFSGEWFRSDADTVRRSADGAVGPPPIRVFADTLAEDRSERRRAGVSWAYKPSSDGWISRATARLDYQDSGTDESSEFNVTTVGMGPPLTLLRNDQLNFQQKQWSSGGELVFAQPGQSGSSYLVGYEWVRRDTSQKDDKQQTNARTGASSNIVDGDVYPRKLYPDTQTDLYGLFVQGDFELLDGRLRIMPSLRFDRFELDYSRDALFENANVLDFTPASIQESAWTPRLGATWRFTPEINAFANYAEGFRTPGHEQLNRIGRVPVATFVHDFLPNPDLGPEKSRGIELGLRGAWENTSAELVIYENNYDDFIETTLTGFIPVGVAGNPLAIRQFQAVNIDEVRIRGIEATIAWELDSIVAPGLTLRGAGTWMEGDNRTADQPLNTVPPAQLVVGLSFDDPGDRWGGEIFTSFVRRKTDVEPLSVQGATVDHATQGSYFTADASAYVRLFGNSRLNLMVNNLFDRRFSEWTDLVNVPFNDPRLGLFTAPGRTWAVSVRTTF